MALVPEIGVESEISRCETWCAFRCMICIFKRTLRLIPGSALPDAGRAFLNVAEQVAKRQEARAMASSEKK